jgi:lipid-A-disaccharide synthase
MKIFLVTGEMSGDKHGAHLARALQSLQPDIELYGIGGEKMKEIGVKVLSDITRLNAFQYRFLPRMLYRRQLNKNVHMFYRFLKKERCDGVVLIGLADDTQYVSMQIAKLTKSLAIPLIYYFAPHVWIWSMKKARGVAELFDKVLTLFPLEDKFYRAAGARTNFIGHPIIDEIESEFQADRGFCPKVEGDKDGKKLVVFFPGSRIGEIKYHLPIIKNIINTLSLKGHFRYAVSAANGQFRERIERYFQHSRGIRVVTGHIYRLIDSADFIFTSAGTITLEIALMEKPCIIFYRMPRITYLIGRCFIRFKYFGLPNVVMDKKIFPEFKQGEINPERMAGAAIEYLNDNNKREAVASDLRELKKMLGTSGAVSRAARVILDTIQDKKRGRH